MPDIAVLSYHGWEIDPDRLVDDVAALRARGWRDVSLAGLESVLLERQGPAVRLFHVTLDDGAEGDLACVEALRRVSCPSTLFVSLNTMTESARAIHRALALSPDVAVEDHSLSHNRTFHYRHVVGFHSAEAPVVTSSARLGLRAGDPVCTYGGELTRPTFTVDERARQVCHEAACQSRVRPGSRPWSDELTGRLVSSGLGTVRFGRLCVTGAYESRAAFRARVSVDLADGHRQLSAYLGRPPVAFAHPWWEPSATADDALRGLGYRLAFSGRGLCRTRSTFAVPRLFVSNTTPRPLNPYALDPPARSTLTSLPRWAQDAGRKAMFR